MLPVDIQWRAKGKRGSATSNQEQMYMRVSSRGAVVAFRESEREPVRMTYALASKYRCTGLSLDLVERVADAWAGGHVPSCFWPTHT